MPTVIIPPTDVSPYTGTGSQVLATNPTFPNNLTVGGDVTLSTNNAYLKGKTSGGSTVSLMALTSDNLTRFIAGVDADGFQWTNQGQTAAWASLSSSALSVTGNLTVSGGSIVNGAGTAVYYFGTPSNNYMYYDGSLLYTRVGGSDRLTISGSTGNVLIGASTDNGNGKLQFASSTATSGGLGFGADVSLYRAAAGTLSLMDYTSAATGVGGVLNLQGFTSGTSGLNNFAIIKGTKSSGTVGGVFTVQTSDTSGNPQTALTIDSSQNATFAGSVKAASEVYAEKSGAGFTGQSTGLITQVTTVDSTTYNVTTGSAKVFVVQLASGDAALCYTSYKSSTITILGSDGTIVNSASPTSTQLGISKSANDHVVSFKTGSNALAGGYASWGFCFLGNPVISIA